MRVHTYIKSICNIILNNKSCEFQEQKLEMKSSADYEKEIIRRSLHLFFCYNSIINYEDGVLS